PPTCQYPRTDPKVVAGQLTLKPSVFHLWVRVPTRRMTDPSKPVGTRCLQCVQHRLNTLPEAQISMTDNGCGRSARAVKPAGAGRGQSLDEFDLAHGTHLLRSVSTIHGAGLNKHGGALGVPTLDVRGQFVEEIPLVGNAI